MTGINAQRKAKDSVFADLFSIPEYLLQLFQALHPEMTDVTEDDIEILSLKSVFINRPYNDLGILVKNKLIILVEAQSTWSVNILIRILLYLATTYHDYIHENGIDLYGGTKADIPEPEFYVIYTGDRKINKDIISLKEDIFENPDAKLDLTARVIHAENKNDIIGQYIIFCHVLDSQRKIYGFTEKAIENTIKICQNLGVLKKYLESRKKEVMNIMFILFDQDYNTEFYGRKQKISGAVEMCKDFGLSIKDSVSKIAEKFDITQERAERYVNEFWEKKTDDDKDCGWAV